MQSIFNLPLNILAGSCMMFYDWTPKQRTQMQDPQEEVQQRFQLFLPKLRFCKHVFSQQRQTKSKGQYRGRVLRAGINNQDDIYNRKYMAGQLDSRY